MIKVFLLSNNNWDIYCKMLIENWVLKDWFERNLYVIVYLKINVVRTLKIVKKKILI